MENSLVNRDFERVIKQMRRVLPLLSFGLLIGTYIISALIMGIFHAESASSLGFKIAAFLVPLAIQAGRGTLVFFFQLNPAHLQSRFSFGIIAATTLLLLSLIEAVLVMLPYGISWTISVSTLMLIGWVIEIMILRETTFATQMELFQNQEQWQELKNFYVARNEFEAFIKNGHMKVETSIGNEVQPNPPELQMPESQNELNGSALGKELRPLQNGQLM